MEADKEVDKVARVMRRKLSRMLVEVDQRIPNSDYENQLALAGEGSGYHKLLEQLESGKLLQDSQTMSVPVKKKPASGEN